MGVWEERSPGRATATALVLNGYFSFDMFLAKLLILSNLSTWLNNYLLNGICKFMSKEKAKRCPRVIRVLSQVIKDPAEVTQVSDLLIQFMIKVNLVPVPERPCQYHNES